MTLIDAAVSVLATVGINPTHFFAGVVGAFVRTAIQKTTSKWEVFMATMVGGACATYLTPLVLKTPWLAGADMATSNGLAFAIGMIGIYITEYAMALMHRYISVGKLPKALDALNVEPDRPKPPENTNPE